MIGDKWTPKQVLIGLWAGVAINLCIAGFIIFARPQALIRSIGTVLLATICFIIKGC